MTTAPQNLEQPSTLREAFLDNLHWSLENDQKPDQSVVLTAFMPKGERLDVCLGTLLDRQRRFPSAVDRRRWLELRLSNFLHQLGV